MAKAVEKSMSRKQLDEVIPFLSHKSRGDVKAIAIDYVTGLTGTSEGRTLLCSRDVYLEAVAGLLQDDIQSISKQAYKALVNLTAEDLVCPKLLSLKTKPNLLQELMKYVCNPESELADEACMLLSNLSRPLDCAKKMVEVIQKEKETLGFDKLIQVFCTEGYNPKAKLHHLGPFLCNLTQIPEARQFILNKDGCVIQRLLPYTQYPESVVRRRGIVATLKNCSFETDNHQWLLSPQVDLLPHLLLPLAGPEEFDEEDNDKLPVELQYLEPTKTREPEPDIRVMLIEAVHQLCATKEGREYLKDKNAYIILRELHNWEKNEAVIEACEDVVSILIGDEPAPEHANLKEVEIPADIQEKLNKASRVAKDAGGDAKDS
ncbi:protein HGH1 homolog isoform X2 [Lingula anatina]|uniref:Protein HGH1 homolog n=1 Tax=Lingula anatina TaxID=7574 RepID=A0A1S3GZV9_LINAN|nr:protein HGH1 homolog isoform X2 [Lingula anatina]|eukprot:XP_013379212.1 protein HGH1 homolog isoform X2 [Lingula anatina]